MRFWIIAVFCLCKCLASDLDVHRRVQCHMLIGDVQAAIDECHGGLRLYPESKPLQRMLVQALAKRGFEKDALKAWHTVAEKLEGEEKRNVLEALAWGVISRASDSNQFVVQYSSLSSAGRLRDAAAVKVIFSRMRSQSSLMRALAVRMATQFRDACLVDEIKRLFVEEKHFYVRLEVIRAVGHLGLKEMGGALKEVISDEKSMAEEKSCAVEALVNLYEEISDPEIEEFVISKRAGLRAIAPQIILHLDQIKQLDKIIPLLSDTASGVKMVALYAFGQLNPSAFVKEIKPLLDDPDPLVQVMASWSLLRSEPKLCEEKLFNVCFHEQEDVRRLAASCLAFGGDKAKKLCAKVAKTSSDPFVSANACLGLILKRYRVKFACDVLHRFVLEHEGKIMWDKQAFFPRICKSRVQHIPQVPSYPTLVDQLARLEILSILAMQDFAKTEAAIKAFLGKGQWGTTHAACATLLGEGAKEALEIVRGLLSSKDPTVRMQAALVLAFMGRETDAITHLEEAYENVSRNHKLAILEALGAVGSDRSLPFLVRALEEPFQLTRVVAASSIIQCLYH